MNFLSIAIPTGILWLLNGIIVEPLAHALTRRELGDASTPQVSGEATENETQKRVYLRNYILADVIVLGLAGFLAGLLGYLLIGLAFRGRDWPGVIAFVLGSAIGVGLANR